MEIQHRGAGLRTALSEVHFDPRTAFPILAFVIGALFAFLTPPFQAPDEVGHFWRAYALARGVVVPDSANGMPAAFVPKGVRDVVGAVWVDTAGKPEAKVGCNRIRAAAALSLVGSTLVRVEFPAQYTPVPYAPQTLACCIGDHLRLRPLVTLYFGRLLNLLVFVVLISVAMRQFEPLSWVIGLIATLPMTLYVVASFSPDALTIGIAICLTAVLLRAMAQPRTLLGRDINVIMILAFLLSLCKPPYFLLAALFVGVPKRHFAARPQKILCSALIAALVAAGAVLSATVAARHFHAIRPGVQIDARAQLHHVIAAPTRFLRLATLDYLTHGGEYARHFIGQLGWLDVPLPTAVIGMNWLLLLAVALKAEIPLTAQQRLLGCIVLLFSLLTISLSQYIAWTAIGAATIDGVQGRYFLPLGPLALAMIASRRHTTMSVRARLVVLGIVLLTNSIALATIARRYY